MTNKQIIDLEREFKSISIRGRYAYAMYCFEIIVNKGFSLYLENPIFKYFIKEHWNLISLDDVSRLDKKIIEMTPSSIMEDYPNNDFNDFDYLSKKDVLSFQDLYKEIPNFLFNIMDSLGEIMLGNLYGSTEKYSPKTLEELLYVLKQLESADFDFPSVPKNIIESNFNENSGWGLANKKEYWLEDGSITLSGI